MVCIFLTIIYGLGVIHRETGFAQEKTDIGQFS